MKVLICGAGIAGLTLAFCLERHGHSVEIVERAPRPRDDGFMIDFFGSGYDAMEGLGLLPDLAAIHRPVRRIIILDAKGRERVSLPYAVLRKRLLRDRHFNFMRGGLERMIRRKLTTSIVHYGTTVESYSEEDCRVCVRLSDGTYRVADLLVGADGVYSRVRNLTFGHMHAVRPLGYQAAAFIVNSLPQLPDIGRDLVTVTAPHHQVALYPTGDGRLAAFFLNEIGANNDNIAHASACSVLRQQYSDLGWIVPDLLDRCERSNSAVYFDSVVQVDLPHWSDGRVVLLGDACQCVSPLAGQGASMAVAGAYILAKLLSDRQLGTALAIYERTLKPTIARQQAAARRIAQWFVPASESRLWMRNLMTRASVLPPVAVVLRRRMAAGSAS